MEMREERMTSEESQAHAKSRSLHGALKIKRKIGCGAMRLHGREVGFRITEKGVVSHARPVATPLLNMVEVQRDGQRPLALPDAYRAMHFPPGWFFATRRC